MNGRTSKLLRRVFDPTESSEKRQEYRRFKKAYNLATAITRIKIRQTASKIAAARSKGIPVKQFRIDPETHTAESIEEGDANEQLIDNQSSLSPAST